MSRRKLSIADLKTQLQTLQDKLEREEQKINCEIGSWIRQQTKVESLKEFQANFVIVPKEKKVESEENDEEVLGSLKLEKD
ncbi:MAG: hypothetical protein IK062_06280 [Selenomonadaceae bacterium]|nr:hypothetical protein [Selenomonadaceae bacterium]